MRIVSNKIKNALNNYTTQRKGTIKVGNNYYDVYNVNYLQDGYEEGKVIGNAIASQLEFDIPYMNKFDDFIYYDAVWVEEDNEYQYVEIGHFNVFDDKDENEFTKHITAFDDLIKFNAPYVPNSSYPITLYEELENVCNQAGIELNNESIPNGSFIVENNQFVNEETLKSVLKAICIISGTFATIKANSLNLQLKNTTNVTINKSQHEPVTWKRRSYGINQVILGNENVIGEYVMREDPEDIALNGVHKLVINDNPFAYTQSKRNQLIDELFEQVKGFGYIPYELKGEWLNYLEVGDTITIDGIETVVLRINGYSPKALQSEMSAPAIIDNSIEYVNNTDSVENRMRRTEIIVDKNTQEIRSIAEKVVDISKTIEGVGQITFEDAFEGPLHNLEIRGNISLLYPNDSTKYGQPVIISDDFIIGNDKYISEGVPYINKDPVYPSENLYPKNSYLQVDDTYYKLDIDYLNYINETTYDRYIYQDGKQWIERNVGIDSNGNMYRLSTPVIENKQDIFINIGKDSTLKLASFTNAILKSEYLLENQYTQVFATEAYVDSEIKQTTDAIELKVSAVTDEQGEITAASIKTAINGDTSGIKLQADNLSLEGLTTINNNFQIDLEGNMTCNDATINGNIVTPRGVLTNLQFGCETWGWTRANTFGNSNGGFIGYNFELGSASSSTQSFLNFCATIPDNFTVVSAKIRLRHSPMTWWPPTGSSTQAGSCKNIRAYVATGLGQSGQGSYMSEAIIGGYAPSLSLINAISSHSFSDSVFQEYTTEDFASTFSSSGVYNIVVKSTDGIPSGATYNNAYQVYGSKTGILTGTLEIIGYMSFNITNRLSSVSLTSLSNNLTLSNSIENEEEK